MTSGTRPDLVRPHGIGPGSTVGIWTPSSPAPALFPRRFARAVSAMTDNGIGVVPGATCTGSTGVAATAPALLAEDLHRLLRNEQVDAVVCAAGGYTSLAVVPYVDWAVVAAARKPIIGYSDVTSILWAALAVASVVTFHGPMVVSEWGEAGGALPYTVERFFEVLAPGNEPMTFGPPDEWTDELLWWDTEDDRPRRLQPGGWRCLVPGTAEGWLLPGCAQTVSRLFGTPYLPDVTGAILCLETHGTGPDAFWGLLAQWQTSGLLDRLAGLVIGRHCRPLAAAAGSTDFDQVVLEVLGGSPIPVLVDVDFGHTEPRLTLPVGTMARLDATACRITLLEAPTVAPRTPERKP